MADYIGLLVQEPINRSLHYLVLVLFLPDGYAMLMRPASRHC